MSILHEYWSILSDPAHTLVELTFTLVVDGLLLGLLWPLIKRRIRVEHKTIDDEHGVLWHGQGENGSAVVDLMKYRKSRERDLGDEPA